MKKGKITIDFFSWILLFIIITAIVVMIMFVNIKVNLGLFFLGLALFGCGMNSKTTKEIKATEVTDEIYANENGDPELIPLWTVLLFTTYIAILGCWHSFTNWLDEDNL